MYSYNDDTPLYLVWDSGDDNDGFVTLTPQKSSERFFAILKYVWQKKEKHG
jgi:hypothetical protein